MTRGTAVVQDLWNQSGHPGQEGKRSHRHGTIARLRDQRICGNSGKERQRIQMTRGTVSTQDESDSRNPGQKDTEPKY